MSRCIQWVLPLFFIVAMSGGVIEPLQAAKSLEHRRRDLGVTFWGQCPLPSVRSPTAVVAVNGSVKEPLYCSQAAAVAVVMEADITSDRHSPR